MKNGGHRQLVAGVLCIAASGCCWGEYHHPDDCIASAASGYSLKARLVGADGCPFRGLEVRLRVMEEGDEEFAESPNFIRSTDEAGDIHFAWFRGAIRDFHRCLTGEELLASTPEQWWVSPLERIELTFQASGVIETVVLGVPAELLTDFTPVDENQLDLGTILVPGVNACDPSQYKDLDFVGFCELSPFYEEERPFILLDDFCQQVQSGEIANVEHYCPRLEAGDAPPNDQFCLSWSADDPNDYDDYSTTLAAWLVDAEQGCNYGGYHLMLAGTCGTDGPLFLSRGDLDFRTERLYFDAEDGRFLGNERWEYWESSFIPPCCGNTYWPEHIECPEPIVAELLCQSGS